MNSGAVLLVGWCWCWFVGAVGAAGAAFLVLCAAVAAVIVAAASASEHWRGLLVPLRSLPCHSFVQEHFSRFGHVEDCIVMMHPDG